MVTLKERNDYESMVVLSSQCTELELKDIAFTYAQQLKRLGALKFPLYLVAVVILLIQQNRVKRLFCGNVFLQLIVLPLYENQHCQN